MSEDADERLCALGTPGPRDDWAGHIDEVEQRSMPLPVALEESLERLQAQLSALAEDVPLAALRQ